MSDMGQTEKNSVRAHVFHFALTCRHGSSFYHLVRKQNDRFGHRQAKCLRGLKIEYKFELGRLFDWKLSGVCSLEYLVDVLGCFLKHRRKAGAVACQAAQHDIVGVLVDCRYLPIRCKRNDGWPHWVSEDKQGVAVFLLHLVKSAFDISTAMRFAAGRILCRSSTDLPTTSPYILAIPVMFFPGCARLTMKPDPIGSVAGHITMGMVDVARWAAAMVGVAIATITSGRRATSSIASESRRSIRPSAPLASMARLLPS